jgi:CarboxypepD_reg-like domain/TonB-dependent Receptor Plug Domain/TonB dependent receptor-like, beta-barrel
VIKFILILFILTGTIFRLSAQAIKTSTVSGFVYDKSTGETLIGANVSLFSKGGTTGTSTNNNGYFVISDAPVGKDTISVSYIGYNSSKIIIIVGQKSLRPLKFYLSQSSINVGEVVVTGNTIDAAQRAFDRPISTINLSSQEINAIPKVVEADLLRALQSTPGITALSDFSSAIYVRGGTPDQNLYLIDGAEIYDPEHAFGIFSSFNTDAIKEVEISKGGFGPQYDDRLSAVIDVIDNDGDRNSFRGTFDLSLIAANLTLQMPLGSLGSISGSFRRTYIDQTIAKWDSDVPPYYFLDGNLKAFLQLSDEDVLTLSYFGSSDNLNFQTQQGNSQSPSILLTWGNTLGSANWKHLFNNKLFSSLYATYSGFHSNFSSINGVTNITETNPLNDYTAREALTYYASNELTMEAGGEYKSVNLSYNRNSNSGFIDLSRNTQEASSYINFDWQPNNLWEVDAGLRFEHFHSDTAYTHFDPRLSAKYKLTDHSSLKFAAGIYHQYMEAVERPFAPDVWLPSDKNIYDSQAGHLILGYEQQIGDLLDLDVETYYKNYKNIYVFNYNENAETSPSYYTSDGIPVYSSSADVFSRGNEKSYGLEILLRKDVGAVTGWIGYSLSKSKDTFDGINQGNSFVPQQSRTSIVNFVLNGNVNSIFSGRWNEQPPKSSSNWIFGLNFIFTSGQPITLPSSVYFVNALPAWDDYSASGKKLPSYELYPGTIDSYKLPDYIRLDLSITWLKDFGSWSLAPYLQIFNIGNRKNVWFINYSSTAQDGSIVQDVTIENQLPFLPSIGVTVKF